jgi:hypothetical protein
VRCAHALEHLGRRLWRVAIADRTPGRPPQLRTTCGLGASGLADVLEETVHSGALDGIAGAAVGDVGRALVSVSAVSAALRGAEAPALGATGVAAAPMHVTSRALQREAQGDGVADTPPLQTVADTAAAHAARAAYTLHPAAGIALQLYRELEDGRLAGYPLLYRRIAETGQVLQDRFLTPHLSLR